MNPKILFLLGAGASTDSGLPTYRGPNGFYGEQAEKTLSKYSSVENIWEFLTPLYEQIKTQENQIGSTYDLIKKLGEKYTGSMIVTQNIDGYAKSTGLPIVELHGTHETMSCVLCKNKVKTDLCDYKCKLCEGYCRPDIVLFDKKISADKIQAIYTYIKQKPEMMIIVGTTLQFNYLKDFIIKAKKMGIRIFHINPDPAYEKNVIGKEIWYQVSANEGLKMFLGKE